MILQNGKSCAKVRSRTFLRMTGRRLVAGTKSKRTTAGKQELEPRAKKTAVQIVRTQCRKIRCKHCQNEAAHDLDSTQDFTERKRKDFVRYFSLIPTHTHTKERFCLKQGERETPRHSPMCVRVLSDRDNQRRKTK